MYTWNTKFHRYPCSIFGDETHKTDRTEKAFSLLKFRLESLIQRDTDKESKHMPGVERVLLIEYDKHASQNSERNDIHTCVKQCVHHINMICGLESGDVSPTHGRWTPCLMQPGWRPSLQINQLSNRKWSNFPGILAIWLLALECRLRHYRYSVPLCLTAKLRWRAPC
jgi:hypothetical protein